MRAFVFLCNLDLTDYQTRPLYELSSVAGAEKEINGDWKDGFKDVCKSTRRAIHELQLLTEY